MTIITTKIVPDGKDLFRIEIHATYEAAPPTPVELSMARVIEEAIKVVLDQYAKQTGGGTMPLPMRSDLN